MSTDLHARIVDLERARADLHDYVHDHPAEPYRTDELATLAGRVAELAALIAGGEYRPAYNGWVNRETWNAALWIDNDQPHSAAAREIVADALARPDIDDEYPDWTPEDRRRLRIHDAADDLRQWWGEAGAAGLVGSPPVLATDSSDLPGPVSDAWTYALAVVDWSAIAEGIAEGIEVPA